MPDELDTIATTHEIRLRSIMAYHHATKSFFKAGSEQLKMFTRRHELPQIERAFLNLEYFAMPIKARNPVSQLGDFAFAQIRLTEQQAEEFSAWLKEINPDFFTTAREFALNGYKFSLTYDDANTCFIASYTNRAEKHVHNGVTVSSRSDDWEEAFWLSVYKISVLYPDKALPTEQRKNNWG